MMKIAENFSCFETNWNKPHFWCFETFLKRTEIWQKLTKVKRLSRFETFRNKIEGKKLTLLSNNILGDRPPNPILLAMTSG